MAKKPSYVPLPDLPQLLEERFRVTLAVMSGVTTVSEAARRLSLSRVQYQTLYHRALHGLIDGLSPRAAGRPPKSEQEQTLERENERLRRENERLRQQAEGIQRMLSVASDLVRDRARLTSPRRTRSKKTTPASEGGNDEDPRPERVRALRRLRVRRELVAAVAGVSASTVGRWTRWAGAPMPVVARRAARLDEQTARQAEQRVRELHGLIGAESLSRAVPGLSRRQAASIKQATLAAIENERKAGVAKVVVTAAGVVRGFDQLWVPTTQGQVPVLVSADACVPYRTSLSVADRYDSAAVARAIDEDFCEHGAPLVWRADRASCHMTEEVDEVLRAWGVLRLHGPPHLARFYGQLERQNREHRGWLDACDPRPASELAETCQRMRRALNDQWPRRSLGWMTAAEKWATRTALCEDRAQLRASVAERAARLRREERLGARPDELLVQRLAIELTLTQRGYLRRESGGWC